MTTYCPHCWAEVDAAAEVCPACWARLADPGSYVAKLIAALRHPEPFTQRRAAYVLGLLRDPSAVAALAAVLAGPADPYVKGEAAHALGAIGGGRACAILQQVAQDESQPLMVRRTAMAACDNQRPVPGENKAAGR